MIPKILAYNSAKDATDLVAKLCTLHNASQKNPEKAQYKRYNYTSTCDAITFRNLRSVDTALRSLRVKFEIT